MNTLSYMALCLAVIAMSVSIYCWIDAERELKRFIQNYYGVPRAAKYKYKPGLLRRIAQSLMLIPRNYQP